MIKKHLVLTVILGICALALVAGLAMSALAFADNSSKSAEVEKNQKTLQRLENRGKNLALSKENVETAEENNKALVKAMHLRVGVMLQPERLDQVAPGSSTEFSSKLLGLKGSWTELCEKNGIIVASDLVDTWGFSRYLKDNGTAPTESLQTLATEAAVIGKIVQELVEARDEYDKAEHAANILTQSQHPFALLKGIQREAVELDEAQSRTTLKDEFVIIPVKDAGDTGLCTVSDSNHSYLSLRRPDAVKAIAVRMEIATETGVIRNLAQRLQNYPVYIRDISAEPSRGDLLPKKHSSSPTPSEPAPEANPFALFGGGDSAEPAAPVAPKRQERVVAVPVFPKIFTITFEYTIPIVSSNPTEEVSKK